MPNTLKLASPDSLLLFTLKSTMKKCSKFTLFNILLLFCMVNFLLYRYFNRPTLTVVARLDLASRKLQSFDFTMTNRNDSRSVLIVNKPEAFKNKVDPVKSNVENDVQQLKIESSASNKNLNFINTRSSTIPLSTSKELNGTYSSDVVKGGSSLMMALQNTTNIVNNQSLPMCPLVPPKLNGQIRVLLYVSTWENIAKENPGLLPGGRRKPPDCVARHRVAIVIPYRNREKHLKVLLKNLHPVLSRQQLDYGVFVVDQAEPGKFNRAMLMNIGFTEAMKRYDYQCAIFHDVDLVPENDKNMYSCSDMPRHMSAAIDKFGYKLPYKNIYGGVSAVSKEQFVKINGFSNMYFGWGGEDDDIAARIARAELKITRYAMDIARYKMIRHIDDKGNEKNPRRFALLKNATKRMQTDGLNSLVYKVLKVDELPTHTRIEVLINETDINKDLQFPAEKKQVIPEKEPPEILEDEEDH